nr:hypothetical protein GCM10025732_54270 [Glycomyces mayteni]
MRTPAARTLADYGVIVRRSWWLVIGTVAAALAAGVAYTELSPEVYESTAAVLVLPTEGDTAVQGRAPPDRSTWTPRRSSSSPPRSPTPPPRRSAPTRPTTSSRTCR